MSIKICLDAGHYGKYNRSPVVPKYYESDMVWKLHLLQKKYLESYGIQVITTRSSQAKDRQLYDRGAAAKGCNLFISDHSNACATESVDRPVAIVTLNGKATALGRQLADVVKEVMGVNDDPKTYTKAGNKGTDWYGVLRGAAAVGVGGIILEHSFHTNTRAANWLLDDNNLDKLAKAEAECIAAYYGLTQQTRPSDETPAPDEGLLEVDGNFGPATIRETQRFLDSIVDAVVSGQPIQNKKYLYSAIEPMWEFISSGKCTGSDMVERLQHFIGATEDRYFGPESVKTFQTFLKNKGYYTGKIDKSMGPDTVKAWQRYLNEH